MNVLHVSLGLPPLRTGGLTRYCIELMEAQFAAGVRVSLLFPGRFLPGNVRIRYGTWRGVETCELINPLPVALTYGIAEPNAFTMPCSNVRAFEQLLKRLEPDMVHVHSFMGIYKEFFQIVKAASVPMVFTTHDYYPLCPRCTFIDGTGLNCVKGASALSCSVCCRGGMTLNMSMVMQSHIYSALKSSKIFKLLSSVVRGGMTYKTQSASNILVNAEEANSYQYLLDYNKTIFELFNLILANSSMSESVYRSIFPKMKYELVHISHAGLTRDFKPARRRGAKEPLVIGYFGGNKEYKGYETLTAAARMLHEAGANFELHLFGDDYPNLSVPEARSFGRVAPNNIRGIMRGLDVVVVPSIYRETFGFTVLESICEGVPVLCSDAVGASELIDSKCIFPAGDSLSLAEKLQQAARLGIARTSIPSDYPLGMDEQVNIINTIYEEVCR
ncbi:glycosyltransferase [Collinsella ihumii]|uniref:glycosyltransferase n=1 Tax=Collinsella ihumii TaxID=1720204 RepID=UPI0025AA46CD|nr:glycosyltransferase [Collinsella ihumii]MDN0055205.1 glycosyltransferase [Collinsella ihumii]